MKWYKELKAAYRALLRKYQKEQRDAFIEEIDLECGDHGKLFCQIRRARGHTAEPTSVLKTGNCVFKGEELPYAWAKYFEQLATPADYNYDDSYYKYINDIYDSILDQALDDFCFTEEEVTEVIKSLKLKKSAGSGDIDPEHPVYGGNCLTAHLTTLFNAIVRSGHISAALRSGLVIPIPIGVTKDLTDPSNYRGITILSTVSKVSEKLVLLRVHMLDSPHPHPNSPPRGLPCRFWLF